MSTPEDGRDRPVPSTRRAALERARRSRRPSRLGTPAGQAAGPDRERAEQAGFPGLLARTWHKAVRAADPRAALTLLLTLDGHVPLDVQLRALRSAEEDAVRVLYGLSWREGPDAPGAGLLDASAPCAHLGEIGLTTGGRVAVGVPGGGPLADGEELVDGVLRVPWPQAAVDAYLAASARSRARYARQAADCRAWLAAAGPDGRAEILETLQQAALRTAPFVLYHEDRRYTNFREHNNLAGKTLWPGHPDCVLTGLLRLPLELWSDADAVAVAAMTLLVHSSGFGRIEEANGTQLTLDHCALMLERTRTRYESASAAAPIAAAADTSFAALDALALSLRARRAEIMGGGAAQLYRRIDGALMHKTELVAAPADRFAREREAEMCARLSGRLPFAGESMDALATALEADADFLAAPHGGFGTGLESVLYQTVQAAVLTFGADFAMSRGMRSLPNLIEALRAEEWARICSWELPEYFCCVVPAPSALSRFGGSGDWVADAAWAMSARMQYNSWHFVPGNLPKTPEVEARDHFVPPTMPDISFHSDQHHHGHVAAQVRFSVRSPQAVTVAGRRFGGFIDLRLLRCDGEPFHEQDLLAAHRVSAFVARATSLAARLAEQGRRLEVTAFDAEWHAKSIIGGTAERAVPANGRTAGAPR